MISWIALAVVVCCVGHYATKTYDRRSGRRLWLDLRDKLRMRMRSVQRGDDRNSANPHRSDIIVCLTTLPSRMARIDGTLKSLLFQTKAPRSIRIHLPSISKREGTPYDVPQWLRDLKAVEIIECGDDYGPATKLVPALLDLPADQHSGGRR